MGSNCSKDPAAKAKKANGAAAVPEVTATRPIASPRPNGVAPRTEAKRGISFRDDRRQTAQPPTSSHRSAGVDYEALEREALKENYLALKESYMKNPTQFLANQMLLSVQFFKNFDRDKEAFRVLKSDTEEDMRESLADLKQKAIVSNAMFHKVLDHVGFRSKDQVDVLEQLLPTEYYIASDFVEIFRKEEFDRLVSGEMEYSTLDKPHYRTCVEKASKFGFEKVRCVDNYEDLVPDGSESGAFPSQGHTPRPGSPSPPQKTNSTSGYSSGSANGGANGGDAAAAANSSGATTAAAATSGGRANILIDHFPTPIEEKRKLQRQQMQMAAGAITEDEEEDEDGPTTGGDLLREIAGRLRGDTPNLSSRGGGSFRASPPMGGAAPAGFRGVAGERRLLPQHSGSDPVHFKSSQRSPLPPASQQPRRTSPRLGEDKRAPDEGRPQPVASLKAPPQNDSPVSLVDDDGYGYVVRRARDLQDAVNAGFFKSGGRKNSLPPRCFRKVESNIHDGDDRPLAASAYGDAAEEKETRVYLSARGFMQNFAAQFYEFARKIDKGHLTSGARILDPRIMCHEERNNDSFGPEAKEASLDFLPTLEVPFWPTEAIEWYLKKRDKVRDKRTGTIYQWPSAEIVSQAQQIGHNLVPVGFVDPVRRPAGAKQAAAAAAVAEQRERGVQWRVEFTRLEGLIQRSLNHPKIRCYLFILLIYRTFLEELNSVRPEHLRHLFYSMVERNPARWPEEQLGDLLVNLLKEMRSALKRQRLQNYFLAKENLFDALPKHKLARAHEKFHRLQENIVPYLMVSIKRLHYDKGFYPTLDVDGLYEILNTNETQALALIINPALLGVGGGSSDASNQGSNAFERSKREAELRRKVKSDPAQEKMRELLRKRQEEQQRRKKEQEGEGAADKAGIDLNLKVTHMDPSRGRLLLQFFARHFLALARRSSEFRADGQCRMYLGQAENLLGLMKEFRFDGTGKYMELQAELEQLRQATRGDARDYWSVSWGAAAAAKPDLKAKVSMGSDGSAAKEGGSFKDRAQPLPHVPQQEPSPIPGTEVPGSNSEVEQDRQVEVEVHPQQKKQSVASEESVKDQLNDKEERDSSEGEHQTTEKAAPELKEEVSGLVHSPQQKQSVASKESVKDQLVNKEEDKASSAGDQTSEKGVPETAEKVSGQKESEQAQDKEKIEVEVEDRRPSLRSTYAANNPSITTTDWSSIAEKTYL